MLEEYIYRGKEKLRCGYTTCSCAAAAKAAAEMLISGSKLSAVQINTPKGIFLVLDVLDAALDILKTSGKLEKTLEILADRAES